MNWKEKLETIGITESNYPPSVKKIVKEYYKLLQQIAESEDLLNADDIDDEEVETINEGIEEMRQTIEEMDALIIDKAEKYKRNEGHYKKMSDARHNKAKNIATAPNGVKVTYREDDNPVVIEHHIDENVKKSSSTGWLIFAGIVAIVTLGAINISNKN